MTRRFYQGPEQMGCVPAFRHRNRVCLPNVSGFFGMIRIASEREKRDEPRRHGGHGEEVEKRRQEGRYGGTGALQLRTRLLAGHRLMKTTTLVSCALRERWILANGPAHLPDVLRALRGESFPLTDVWEVRTSNRDFPGDRLPQVDLRCAVQLSQNPAQDLSITLRARRALRVRLVGLNPPPQLQEHRSGVLVGRDWIAERQAAEVL